MSAPALSSANFDSWNWRKSFNAISALLTLFLFNTAVHAAEEDANPITEFGDFRVVHTIFNSSFITEDIAKTYGIVRGKDRALINISLVKQQDDGSFTLGLPVSISGSAVNLMQQKQVLDFLPIEEQNAHYYLAEVRFLDKEIIRFDIEVTFEGQSFPVSFTKKLYHE